MQQFSNFFRLSLLSLLPSSRIARIRRYLGHCSHRLSTSGKRSLYRSRVPAIPRRMLPSLVLPIFDGKLDSSFSHHSLLLESYLRLHSIDTGTETALDLLLLSLSNSPACRNSPWVLSNVNGFHSLDFDQACATLATEFDSGCRVRWRTRRALNRLAYGLNHGADRQLVGDTLDTFLEEAAKARLVNSEKQTAFARCFRGVDSIFECRSFEEAVDAAFEWESQAIESPRIPPTPSEFLPSPPLDNFQNRTRHEGAPPPLSRSASMLSSRRSNSPNLTRSPPMSPRFPIAENGYRFSSPQQTRQPVESNPNPHQRLTANSTSQSQLSGGPLLQSSLEIARPVSNARPALNIIEVEHTRVGEIRSENLPAVPPTPPRLGPDHRLSYRTSTARTSTVPSDYEETSTADRQLDLNAQHPFFQVRRTSQLGGLQRAASVNEVPSLQNTNSGLFRAVSERSSTISIPQFRRHSESHRSSSQFPTDGPSSPQAILSQVQAASTPFPPAPSDFVVLEAPQMIESNSRNSFESKPPSRKLVKSIRRRPNTVVDSVPNSHHHPSPPFIGLGQSTTTNKKSHGRTRSLGTRIIGNLFGSASSKSSKNLQLESDRSEEEHDNRTDSMAPYEFGRLGRI